MKTRRRGNHTASKFVLLAISLFLVASALFVPLSTKSAHALSGAYPASQVIGQTNYTNTGANAGGSVSGAGLNIDPGGGGIAVDTVNHRLFVADTVNNRVLVYPLSSSNNLTSTTATYVLGQVSVTATAAGSDVASGLSNPEGLAFDSTNNLLYVADTNNNRVMVFNTANLSDDMSASYVLGQTGLTSNGFGDTQSTLHNPNRLTLDPNDHLVFVSDGLNYRVLAFSTSALSATGENASYVIGQASFTASAVGQTQSGLSSSAFQLANDMDPTGITYDSADKLVWVSDPANSRVLAYSTTNLSTTGENASYVLGTTSYTSDTDSGSANQGNIAGAYGLVWDSVNDVLYVVDANDNRILGYPLSSGITNGENASTLIGQSTWSGAGNGVGQTVLNFPAAIALDTSNNQMFVSDWFNNRVLEFNLVSITNSSSLAAAVSGQAYSQTLSTTGSQGTVSFSLTGGSLPPGLSFNGTTGTISGTPTTAGTYTFEIAASDNTGTTGTFTQDPSYTITVSSPSSPNTGFGIFTNNIGQTLLAFAAVVGALTSLAVLSRRFAKR